MKGDAVKFTLHRKLYFCVYVNFAISPFCILNGQSKKRQSACIKRE